MIFDGEKNQSRGEGMRMTVGENSIASMNIRNAKYLPLYLSFCNIESVIHIHIPSSWVLRWIWLFWVTMKIVHMSSAQEGLRAGGYYPSFHLESWLRHWYLPDTECWTESARVSVCSLYPSTLSDSDISRVEEPTHLGVATIAKKMFWRFNSYSKCL